MTGTPRLLLLGSATVAAEGDYRYRVVADQDAIALVRAHAGSVASRIGHAPTASLLTEILGLPVQVDRSSSRQDVGETAVVVRPRSRVPRVGELRRDELIAVGLEWGLLERIS